jgi:peptide/nickel transport system substrate-binding protein
MGRFQASRRIATAVAVIAVASLVATACGSETNNSSATTAATSATTAASGATPATSGGASSAISGGASSATSGGGTTAPAADKTLVVENSFDLKTADPGRMFEITGSMIVHSMYEPLLTFNGSDVSKPVPLIAKSYELSTDGKTMTLPLRDDVTFSDGTKLTAADVVFSFNRVKNLKGNPSFLVAGVTASAKDDHTVVLTSDQPNPALPFLITNPALGIVNSKVVKEHGGTDAVGADKADTAEQWLDANSAGSGPYTLQSFSTTTEVDLVSNPNYWGPTKPTYTKIVIRNVTADVQKLNVEKGESQLALDLSPQQAEGISGDVDVHSDPTSNTFFVFSNNNPAISKVTSNKDFQTAVRYGLDYDSLVKLAGKGSVQAPGIIPTLFLGALPADQAIKTDLDKAKAALKSSGYNNEEVDMEYPSDLTKNGISFDTMAQRVQSQLKAVGINVVLKPAPVATSLPNYRDGKEQLGLWLWGADYPDPSDYLAFLPGATVGLRAGWAADADPDLTALGTKAATEIDTATRGQLFQQIQQKMNASGPFMPLFQSAQVAITAKSVTGFAYNAIWTVEFAALK